MTFSNNSMIAFYGYKGGTGRSFLLANLAYAMATHGKKVLVVDCDLEAPGIGDYFDVRLGDLSGKWKANVGILDLIVKRQQLFEADDRPDIKDRIKEKLRQPDVLVNVGPGMESNRIQLLGPGSHDWTPHSPMGYVAEILEFDWTAFITSPSGQSYLRALGEALRESADVVLIDSRTGYNFHSLMLLQIWQPIVLGISTIAWQSLDGLSRMMRVFSESGMETGIVLSKLSDKSIAERQVSASEAGVKHLLVEQLFPRSETLAAFPFIADLLHGDRLLWARPEFWRQFEKSTAETSTPEQLYLKEFANLFQSLTGTTLDVKTVRAFTEGTQSDNKDAPPNAQEAGRVPDAASGEPDPRSGQSVASQGARRAFDSTTDDEDDPQIYRLRTDLFLNSVKAYCMVRHGDKSGATSPVPAGPSGEGLTASVPYEANPPAPGGRTTDQTLVPSLDLDPNIQRWRLENRERARVELAVMLEKERNGPDKEKWNASRVQSIEEANYLAVLPIPPANIAPVEDRSREQSEAAFWKDFGSVINGGPLEETVQPHGEDQERAQDLKRLIVESRDAKTNGPIIALGAALLQALSGKGFRVPSDDDGLRRWNALDGLLPYIGAVRELCRPAWDPVAIDQLDQVQKGVLDLLARARPREASRTWDAYFRTAIVGRRLVQQHRDDAPARLGDRVPHGIAGLLSEDEAGALERALGEGVQETVPDDPNDALSAASRAFSLVTIRLLSGKTKEGVGLFRGLCESVLAPGRIHPPREDWSLLIQELANAADDLRTFRLSSRLCRLVLRLTWQRGAPVNTWAPGLAVALFRAGLPVSEKGMLDKLVENAEKTKDGRNYRWWSAGTLCRSGAYRATHELLTKPEVVGDKVEDSVHSWRLETASRLGQLDLSEHFQEWWKVRRGILNVLTDDQSWWLRLVDRITHVALAAGEDSTRLLEQASEVESRRQTSVSDGLRAIMRVRLVLARSRKLGANARTTAGQALAQEAQGLLNEIEGYKQDVRVSPNLGSDRAFAEYLGLQWDEVGLGDGMFKGDEAPSPVRQVLAELLVEYAEVLLYAGKRKDVEKVAVEVEEGVLGGYDERDRGTFLGSNRLAYCYPIAAASALQFAVSTSATQKMKLRDRAKRHRDEDLAANGQARGTYYDRIFAVCGLDLPAFAPPVK